VTRLPADDQGFESQQDPNIYHFSETSRLALEPSQPPTQWVKQLRLKADHSSPSSTKVNNEKRYTSTPVCLHGMFRDNFSVFPLPKYNISCKFIRQTAKYLLGRPKGISGTEGDCR
jgi:hypothetical protein